MRRRPVKSGVKAHSSTVELPWILAGLRVVEGGGMDGVAVKCIDTAQNPDCEGSLLGVYRRSGTKAWGANRIRYPGSPRRKRWILVASDRLLVT